MCIYFELNCLYCLCLLFRQVSLGAGTTKGGFQIKRLHQIHNQNNVGVIFAPFAHGTSVYLTAIAENHAGLKTVFHSDPAIIIDHTAPILTDINVAVAVDRNNSVSLHGTWKVKDDESGVQFCKFSVGLYTFSLFIPPLCKRWKGVQYVHFACVSSRGRKCSCVRLIFRLCYLVKVTNDT